MTALLWQKTIFPESVMTSGLGATGAQPGFSAEGRPVVKLPLDDEGEVSVVVRCGRILEPLASIAPLRLLLAFFADCQGGSFAVKVQCDASNAGDDGDGANWNATETSIGGAFPVTQGELVCAAAEIPAGDARDTLDDGDDLDILLRLLPDAGHAADTTLYLRSIEVRQELPDA